MNTEARVPDSSLLDDSLEESGTSPIIPIIKYSPIKLTPAAASLSYEEENKKNDTITKNHEKEIVTESPVSSPLSLSPKLKIVPCFGRKKVKDITISAKKRAPPKAKPPLPPPPPPSCSSSQGESLNGVKSLSVESDNMSAREGSPLKPLQPKDDALVEEARAPPTIPAISGVLEETDSTCKVAKSKKKKTETKEKGVSLKIKNAKNPNKTEKAAKKVEKITKEAKKDGGASKNKNSTTSKNKGAQKAKESSETDKETLKVTEIPLLQEAGSEGQNGEEERERAKRELEEFLREEDKLDKKIQAERKRMSQRNNSIKPKKLKKCTVSTKTESIISTSPDQLKSTPPFYMTESQSSSESYSSDEFPPSPESNLQQSDESAPPSQKEKDNDGIWVQCDNPDCLKWRFLINVKDPMEVPDKWYCDMNKDSKYNSCTIEEEEWSSLDADEVYVYSPYTPGSLLLAKLEGYPWWPAIIEADPDTDTYYEAKDEKGGKSSPATPEKYHVVFIDTPVSRSWIHTLNTAPFTCSTTLKDCGPNVPLKYQAGLSTAISQARAALSLPLNERLSQWGFMCRYGKGSKRKNSTKQGGKPSKRATDKMSNKND